MATLLPVQMILIHDLDKEQVLKIHIWYRNEKNAANIHVFESLNFISTKNAGYSFKNQLNQFK